MVANEGMLSTGLFSHTLRLGVLSQTSPLLVLPCALDAAVSALQPVRGESAAMIRVFCGIDDRERVGLAVFSSSVWHRADTLG